MSLSTTPATIAFSEHRGSSLDTWHFRNKDDLVAHLLRHREYFALIEAQFAEAKKTWDQEAIDDAAADAEILRRRELGLPQNDEDDEE
jgi:AcrR family transcriptional regulator